MNCILNSFLYGDCERLNPLGLPYAGCVLSQPEVLPCSSPILAVWTSPTDCCRIVEMKLGPVSSQRKEALVHPSLSFLPTLRTSSHCLVASQFQISCLNLLCSRFCYEQKKWSLFAVRMVAVCSS